MADYTIPTSPLKRLRYYNNQFLTEKDFIDDQAAHLAHERAYLRALCTPGVWEGLIVSYGTLPTTSAPAVGIGIAVDNQGRLIVLDPAASGPAPATLGTGTFVLSIRYNEVATDMSTNTGGVAGTADNTRFTSQPALAATAPNAVPAGAVVLGTFTVSGGQITSRSDAGRQYAGLRLPGPLLTGNPPPATLASRNDSTADGALLTGTLTVQKINGSAIGPSLTLHNPNTDNGGAGGASSGGALDFNSYDPGTNAPAARIQSLGDANFSSHLTLSTKQPGAAANALVERFRITSAGAAQFTGALSAPSVAATTSLLTPVAPASVTTADTLFTSSVDNELYWRNHASANVKLTANGAVNGGIVGDYSTVGAALAFEDANDRYTFKQQAPGNWARIACGEVRIFETGTTESAFVGLAAPASLSASFTLTLPTAAPEATSLVLMASSGVLSATNAVPNLVSFAGGIALTGTGEEHHQARTMTLAAAAFRPNAVATGAVLESVTAPAGGPGESPTTYISTWRVGSVGELVAAIPLRTGDRIISVTALFAASGPLGNFSITLGLDPPTGSSESFGSTSSGGVSVGILSARIGPVNYTLVTDDALYLRVSARDNNVHLVRATVTWDRP
jgi:hypothetical protein